MTHEQKITGWITKYALTKGIIETEIALNKGFPDMVSAKSMGPFAVFHGDGKEWHRNQTSAVGRALLMRNKKILAMRKRIEKIESMKFDIVKL